MKHFPVNCSKPPAALALTLVLPVAAWAQQPPDPPPVDPATPVDTAPPADAIPPADPMESTPPWMPPTGDQAAQSPPPATPPAQSGERTRVLRGQGDREVRVREHPPGSVVGAYSVDFDDLDGNGDGHLSRDEARANATLEAEFDGVDRNADGRLSREELAGWSR